MSLWALWDRVIPLIAILASYRAGISLGKVSERASWLGAALLYLDEAAAKRLIDTATAPTQRRSAR